MLLVVFDYCAKSDVLVLTFSLFCLYTLAGQVHDDVHLCRICHWDIGEVGLYVHSDSTQFRLESSRPNFKQSSILSVSISFPSPPTCPPSSHPSVGSKEEDDEDEEDDEHEDDTAEKGREEATSTPGIVRG